MEIQYPIIGWSLTRLCRDQLDAARKAPADWAPTIAPLPPLKHADDQTVASLVALRRACDEFSLGTTDFSDWGLVAAPRFLGRAAVGRTLRRYPQDGAWGVSMQLIPQHMLHSPASMLSIALGLQGPAVGAGGGLEAEAEAPLAAMSYLQQNIAGLWLVWSGWAPELVVSPLSEDTSASSCVAVAVAIQKSPTTQANSWLRVRRSAAPGQSSPTVAGLLSRADRAAEQQSTEFSHTIALRGDLRISIELRSPASHPPLVAAVNSPNWCFAPAGRTGS